MEPLLFFIVHYIHYKTMSFLFNSVLYFPHNYHNGQGRKKGIGMKNINYNKVNSNFFLSVSQVCASYLLSGYLFGGICPRGYKLCCRGVSVLGVSVQGV